LPLIITLFQNIVRNRLKFLSVEEYSDTFIDNGYDDLETGKLIQRNDLEAIGGIEETHQDLLLTPVKTLKERGATWVHFLCCETAENSHDNFNSESGNNISSSSGPESYMSWIYL
jgi:hypothetical protein